MRGRKRHRKKEYTTMLRKERESREYRIVRRGIDTYAQAGSGAIIFDPTKRCVLECDAPGWNGTVTL